MRSILAVGLPFLVVCLTAAAACSDADSGSGNEARETSEAGAPRVTPAPDAGGDSHVVEDGGADGEPPLEEATEIEPNDGTPETAVGTLKLPGRMNGSIAPANDADLFAIELAPGEFWEWTATPTTTDLAPHITVFDSSDNFNPVVVGFAGPGAPAKLQHFVMRPGRFFMAMRDARNVSARGNKGGASFGYAVTATRGALKPIEVTFPVTKSGKLASVGSVDLYTFTGTAGKSFDITINAARKVPASTLNSRLSLFDTVAKKAVITNDNVSASITDSHVGGDPLPSTYIVVVENEGEDGADLSYEIQFSLRP